MFLRVYLSKTDWINTRDRASIHRIDVPGVVAFCSNDLESVFEKKKNKKKCKRKNLT